MKYLIFLFFLLGFLQHGNSQVIYDYHNYLSELENSGNPVKVAKAAKIKDLYTGLYNTTYFIHNGVQVYGGPIPKRVHSAAEFLKGNGSQAVDLAGVEILSILVKHPDLIPKCKIEQELLNRMPRLKYVIIISEFVANANDFTNVVQHLPTDVLCLHRISITE